ncbi:unnamed protein product [Durusdinium trenchii]|uniref:SET domain-containing protein n=1 Tax=Durusdinium trenchii TaxID=1381693 RepID=A0ABP0MTY4_9DINO
MPLDKGTVERTWSQMSFSYKEKGIITSWNKKAEEVLGHKSQDVVGKVWTDLVSEGWAEHCLEALEKVQLQGEEVVLPLVTGDGLHSAVRCVVRKFGRCSCFLFSCGHTPPSPTVCTWPLEIRSMEGLGKCAFALRDLPAGEMILEEEPFYTRMPRAQLQKRPEWDQAWLAAFNGIRAALKAPEGSPFSEMPEKPLLASTALVLDLISFVLLPESLKGALYGFSSPALDSDHALVEVARQLAELCKERLPECKDADLGMLQFAILVTEMNIFPGGRIFWTMSRINHSCAPNCVFSAAPNRWGLRSVRPISAGEEITISYLGEELLLPTVQRQWLLWRSKCFICGCRRCASPEDPLRDRACSSCMPLPKRWRVVHQPAVWRRKEPSTAGRAVALLKEGTEFDTNGVSQRTKEGLWIFAEDSDLKKNGWVLVDGSTLGLGQLIEPIDEEFANIWPGRLKHRLKRTVFNRPGDAAREHYLNWYDLDAQKLTAWHWRKEEDEFEESDSAGSSYARFSRERNWTCESCGEEIEAFVKEEQLLGEVAQRVFAMALHDQRRASAAGVKGLVLPDENFVLTALRLADDAGRLFGRRHWIWQMGLLFAVDLDLSLNRFTYRKWDAEWISGTASMLLEVWDWLASLELSQAPSYFLHSRASRLSKEMENVVLVRSDVEKQPAVEERFLRLRSKLQRRVDGLSPPVSILPDREFIPETLFIAH